MMSRLGLFATVLLAATQAFGVHAPTKDDVLLVNGQALSINRFLSLKSWLGVSSNESALWVGKATLALHSEFQLKAQIRIGFREAAILARYALGHVHFEHEAALVWREAAPFFGSSTGLPTSSDLRAKLDELISRSVIQQNTQVLAELR